MDHLPDCAFCGEPSLHEVIDFGHVALAGAFLKASQFIRERKYRLRLAFCQNCYAVQIIDPVDPDILFKDYFYFSSQIESVRDHFRRYAHEATKRFTPENVLEIGCNDGFLLKQMADYGANVIGVDPAKNIVETIDDGRLTLINDFFTEEVAARIVVEHGQQDMVLASNVFAHVRDIHGITRAIRDVMTDDGVAIIEVHNLGSMIRNTQYDWIYHEHLYYYSCLSLSAHLEAHGLQIFDLEQIPLHGGSTRYFVCKQGMNAVHTTVLDQIDREYEQGLDKIETYIDFAERVRQHKCNMMELIDGILSRGKRVAAYGASGRANTILQYCGIDARHVGYVIDDAPAKHGFYTPGSHLPIYPRDSIKSTRPDYMLILAWPYAREIMNKINVDAIVPLPRLGLFEC